jgi:DNA primase
MTEAQEKMISGFEQEQEDERNFDIDMLKEYQGMQAKLKFEDHQFVKEIEKEHPDFIIQCKQEKVKRLTETFKNITENYEKSIWRGKLPNWLLRVFKELRQPEKILKEIKKLKREIDFIQNRDSLKEGEITYQDIAKAKEHPFENLIETTNGKAVCPFHPEDTPSFSIHKEGNFGYCFGCNKGVDTIQFVMETKKLSFVEAVKMLR